MKEGSPKEKRRAEGRRRGKGRNPRDVEQVGACYPGEPRETEA